MSAPLRIWHVNVGNHAGAVDGVATVATQLARVQTELGHRVTLITAADEAHHDEVRSAAGPDVDLELAVSPGVSFAAARTRLSGGGAPDVVHLHSVFRPVHRVLAALVARRGIPVVLSPHAGLAPDLLRRDRLRKGVYGTLVERRFHRRADGVHALQLVEAEDVRRYARASRDVEVIANPVDPALLTGPRWHGTPERRGADGTPERRGADTPVVVLLCRYDVYQKGLDRLDAIARRLPDVEFRVHGHADKNDPDAATALAAAAPPNLRFERPVYGGQKLAALTSADLFLQPSRVEGLSISLVEAMALGVPCAVSRYVGRSLDMARHGTASVLDDEPAAAAAEVAALLTDPSRRQAIGRAGADYAARHFAPTAVAEAHVAHYRRLSGAVAATPR